MLPYGASLTCSNILISTRSHAWNVASEQKSWHELLTYLSNVKLKQKEINQPRTYRPSFILFALFFIDYTTERQVTLKNIVNSNTLKKLKTLCTVVTFC
jgi:hypothetical protein